MVKVDLHIHSALSACAENIMSPGRILHKAYQSGLDMVAITDHNASGSLHVASLLAPQYNIKLIFGMEVSTWEDVHLLAFFDSLDAIIEFQAFIDNHLPKLENLPKIYGYQVIYDEHDEIVDIDHQLRQTGIEVNLTDVVAEIHECHGIAVPAHVFRGKFSVISQLGFIDPSADFDLVEIAATRWQREKRVLGEKICGFTTLPNSDAHFLDDVGRTYFELPHFPNKLADLSELISSSII